MSIASRPGHCRKAECPGYTMRLLSAQGEQMSPRGNSYGYDVIVRIGWQRQEFRRTYAEIHQEISGEVQISLSEVSYLYQQVY